MIVQMKQISPNNTEESRSKLVKNMVKGALVEHYGKPLTPDTIDIVAKEIASNISIFLKIK